MSTRKTTIALAAVALVLSTAAPATAASSALAWAQCADHETAQCATLTLPIDRADPGKGSFGMAVARIPATDPGRRIGALVVNPGGPGASGVDFAFKSEALFPEEIRARFDIVGFDPRGIGASQPIQCASGLVRGLAAATPRDQAGFDRLVAGNRALRDDCRARSGPLFDHVDTGAVADDLDDLRIALDEPMISYFGVSYGSLIGQQYARQHGDRLRAAVLDGNMDHSLGLTDFAATAAGAAEDALAEFASWCSVSTECALHGVDVLARWRELLAAADEGKLYEGEPTNPSSPWYVLQTAYGNLSRADVVGLGRFLASLHIGTPKAQPDSPAATVSDETVSNGRLPVLCQDWDMRVADQGQLDRLVAAERAAAPNMRYSTELREAWLGCVGWPSEVNNPPAPARVDPRTPTILLTNPKHDPATGHAWAANVHRQLPTKTTLLTYDGIGHTAYPWSGCVRGLANTYLLDGSLPAPDTVCPAG
ncbi:alpha/beta hydrolase [Amycolatopsis sp. EV170708-02-1]|uniref:alpha/beta hydrolase n=1 Tax=Amycolatopsis sp. EV170708-02-1 TaxID=2919322 RepID=UPI001F0C1D9D|nr:alpha/beta hydrolase [Amycolatopsis sp. EV170708-02-1]UMP01016.1 alpha/beta hydrolase [Amycolatopsis sp. EV170708-02-1]